MSDATPNPIQFRWYLSVAVVLFVFVVVAVYSYRMAHDTTGYDDDQARLRYAKLATMRAQDQKTLTTADWIDKDKGIVRIPVDEAMSEEVAVLQAKPVAAGAEIPGAVAPANVPASSAPSATSKPGGAPVTATSGRASDNNTKPTK